MIKPLIYISINNASAESLKYVNGFHLPDTLLRRLESLNLSHVVDALNSANRFVLSSHAKDGMKMAIDFTEEPYYGKLDMYVTRSKYKSGTDRFHTFATISVVGKEEKERLTLYSLPVTMLDTKEDIVKKLLENSPRPSVLLMNRGFFKTEMIKLLESMGISFIMPAVRNERIKRMLDEYAKGNIPSVYEIGSKFYLVIARKKGSKEEDKPVDKFIAFVTNIKFDDPERIVDIIPEEYRYRWGIETSYRVEDGFEAKTTSRSFTLRVIYFMTAFILYNLWIIARAGKIKYREITAYIFRKTIEGLIKEKEGPRASRMRN
ncbi:MAG: transposase [Nitrososphaeria archaeon]